MAFIILYIPEIYFWKMVFVFIVILLLTTAYLFIKLLLHG